MVRLKSSRAASGHRGIDQIASGLGARRAKDIPTSFSCQRDGALESRPGLGLIQTLVKQG